MKRQVSMGALAVLTLASVSPQSATLAEQDDTAAKSEKTSEAVAVALKNSPQVDGEVDDVWQTAPENKVDKIVASESSMTEEEMAKATVKLLWDADHLYALWIVNDSKLSASGFAPHEQDSVELFIDELNEKAGSYQQDDAQYRVSFEGEISGGGGGYDADKVKAVAKKTDTGYLVEMSIKLSYAKREVGSRMGLELQVNDNPGDGARGAIAKWNHTEDDTYLSTSDFGTVVLKEAAEK